MLVRYLHSLVRTSTLVNIYTLSRPNVCILNTVPYTCNGLFWMASMGKKVTSDWKMSFFMDSIFEKNKTHVFNESLNTTPKKSSNRELSSLHSMQSMVVMMVMYHCRFVNNNTTTAATTNTSSSNQRLRQHQHNHLTNPSQ